MRLKYVRSEAERTAAKNRTHSKRSGMCRRSKRDVSPLGAGCVTAVWRTFAFFSRVLSVPGIFLPSTSPLGRPSQREPCSIYSAIVYNVRMTNVRMTNNAPRKRHPITPHTLLETKRLSDPQIHPDGQRVVFVASEADFDESQWISHLWITEHVLAEPDNDPAEDAPELGHDASNDGEASLAPVAQSDDTTNPAPTAGNTDSDALDVQADEAPEDDTDPTRQLTFSRDGETHPRWSPDGRMLAFLSPRIDETEPLDEDDDPLTEQIWLLPIDGGEARRLTNAKEGVLDYAWDFDTNSLVYLAPEPRPAPVESVRKTDRDRRKVDATVEQDDRLRRQFWRVDAEDRKPKLLFTADYGVTEFAVSPDGKRLCYATNYTGDPNDYHIVDLFVRELETGATHKLLERAGGKYLPKWSPDGAKIAFLSWLDPLTSYSNESLYVVDVQPPGVPTDSVESALPSDEILLHPCTVEGFDYDIDDYAWSRHDGLLYAIATVGTGSEIYRITPTEGPNRSTVRLELNAAIVRDDLSLDPGGTGFAFVQESVDALPEIVLVDEANEAHILTKLNVELLEGALIPRQEVVRWQSDDLTIEGVLTYPQGWVTNSNTPCPLIVQIHGGPKGRIANTLRNYGMASVWAAEGYAVLQPNFRGSSGYGNAFAVANRRDLGGGDFRDIMAGVDWAIEAGIADPQQLGVMGGSYGGYMTNWAIGHTNRFAAAVSMFGIFHLQTDYSNSELSRWDNDYLGAYYWEDPEIYRRLSPGSYIDSIKTPTLIIHGDEDSNTFISNSKELYQALRHRGVTTQFVHYPREGHGLNEPNHKLDEIRRCLAWMDKYVRHGGRNPDVYRIGDKVPNISGGLEMLVTRAEIGTFIGQPKVARRPSEVSESADMKGSAVQVEDNSAGNVSEDTALLEIVLTIHNLDTRQTAAPLTLTLNDMRLTLIGTGVETQKATGSTESAGEHGGEIRAGIAQESEPLLPVGVPLDLPGGKFLLEGDNLRLTQHPDAETGRLAFSVAAIFRVSRSGGEAHLQVVGFPPVIVQWSANEANDDDNEGAKDD